MCAICHRCKHTSYSYAPGWLVYLLCSSFWYHHRCSSTLNTVQHSKSFNIDFKLEGIWMSRRPPLSILVQHTARMNCPNTDCLHQTLATQSTQLSGLCNKINIELMCSQVYHTSQHIIWPWILAHMSSRRDRLFLGLPCQDWQEATWLASVQNTVIDQTCSFNTNLVPNDALFNKTSVIRSLSQESQEHLIILFSTVLACACA